MTFCSSRAPLFRFDAHDNTFCGVHLGGEAFFYYIQKLLLLNYYLIQKKIIVMWYLCKIGEYYQDERWPQGWNHVYTVSHPHFVLMYLCYGTFLDL